MRCAESSQFKVGSQSISSTLLAYSSIPMTQAVTNEVPLCPPDEAPCQQSPRACVELIESSRNLGIVKNDDEGLRLPSSTNALPMHGVPELLLSIDDYDFDDIHKMFVFRQVHDASQNARALLSDVVDDEREELVLLEDHTFEFHQNHAHYNYFSTFYVCSV